MDLVSKSSAIFLCLLFSGTVVAEQPTTSRPNVVLICVDDLRPELKCYGAEYVHSPNIDGLAQEGRLFSRHFVQAPTCGASRFAMLTGRYGTGSNMALFNRAKQLNNGDKVTPSMPAWFRQHGYKTVSVGKVSHHPGGCGGSDWDDRSKLEMPESWDRNVLPAGKWQHPRGWIHGLANGQIRGNARAMDVFQSVEGDDSIYPDGLGTEQALTEIQRLTKDDQPPFFLAVGILRPHLPFGAPAKYMTHYKDKKLPAISNPTKPAHRTTWHGSGEFMKYNRWGKNPNNDAEFADQVRRHYAACVSFADAQVGQLLDALKSAGVWDNTIVVLWGDHGWHLGEHAVWGKHTLFDESLRSPLIIRTRKVRPGTESNAIVESTSIFPTLCELAEIAVPEFVAGRSLVSDLQKEKTVPKKGSEDFAVSYHGNAATIRTATHRLIRHNDGYLELYDDSVREFKNVATEQAEKAKKLSALLSKHLKTQRSKSAKK